MRRAGSRLQPAVVALLALVLTAPPVSAAETISGSVANNPDLKDYCLLNWSLTGLDRSQTYRVDVIAIDGSATERIASQPNYSSLSFTYINDGSFASHLRSDWGLGGSYGVVGWRFDLYRTTGGTSDKIDWLSVSQGCTFKGPKSKRR